VQVLTPQGRADVGGGNGGDDGTSKGGGAGGHEGEDGGVDGGSKGGDCGGGGKGGDGGGNASVVGRELQGPQMRGNSRATVVHAEEESNAPPARLMSHVMRAPQV